MAEVKKDHLNEKAGLRIGPLWILPGVSP
ncbi:uncharacterized protein METZ01_LOCUS100469, partial [marine metagenome]